MPDTLSEAHQLILLNAVPSFRTAWKEWLDDRAEYERRFPDDAMSPDDLAVEFRLELAGHLGRRVASGDLGEMPPLFATLEDLYATADDDLEAELTVGFLEDLIYSIQHHGGTASVLNDVPKGPRTAGGWRVAYDYIHHSRGAG